MQATIPRELSEEIFRGAQYPGDSVERETNRPSNIFMARCYLYVSEWIFFSFFFLIGQSECLAREWASGRVVSAASWPQNWKTEMQGRISRKDFFCICNVTVGVRACGRAAVREFLFVSLGWNSIFFFFFVLFLFYRFVVFSLSSSPSLSFFSLYLSHAKLVIGTCNFFFFMQLYI